MNLKMREKLLTELQDFFTGMDDPAEVEKKDDGLKNETENQEGSEARELFEAAKDAKGC